MLWQVSIWAHQACSDNCDNFTPTQEIKRDSINAKGQSAFWHNRYTLRRAAQSGAVARAPPTEVSSGYGGMSKLGEGTPSDALDVPTFLNSLKDTILTTGGPEPCTAPVAASPILHCVCFARLSQALWVCHGV